MKLEGKVVLVTGAGGGIGALAVFFATNDNVTGQAFNIDGGHELH